MEVLRVAICDDDDNDAARLRSAIEESGVPAEITCFTSGGSFLASHPSGQYDLVLFDILMGDIIGVEAARVLRESDEDCSVVFVTSSEDYRPEAFDVGASQYLIKPVDREKLYKIIRKIKPKNGAGEKGGSCIANVKGERMEVAFDDIMYVEVKNHNCFVHTKNGVIETGTTMTIKEWQQHLSQPRFIRCHKSFIVNLSYVKAVGRDFTMANGDTVYIRRNDIAKCKNYKSELDRWRLDDADKDEDQ